MIYRRDRLLEADVDRGRASVRGLRAALYTRRDNRASKLPHDDWICFLVFGQL